MSLHIAPSILAADFYDMKPQLDSVKAAGVTVLHVDVMDGRFVPNLSVGVPVVASLSGRGFELDVHLMIEMPGRYVRQFAEAGADWLTVHYEAVPKEELPALLGTIKSLGCRPGLSIRPDTEVEAVSGLLPLCEQLLIMTVPPGFGGQGFHPDGHSRIRRARKLIDSINPKCLLSADGGLDSHTVGDAVKAGLERVVAGSAVFGAPQPGEAVGLLMRMGSQA